LCIRTSPVGPTATVVAEPEAQELRETERASSAGGSAVAVGAATASASASAPARGVEASRNVLDDCVEDLEVGSCIAAQKGVGRVMEALGKRGEETLVAAESGRPLSPLLSESTDCRSGARRGSVADEVDAHSVSALLALSVLLREVGAGDGDGDGDEALGCGAGGLERGL
jgi:hypothetical protein